MSDKKSFDTSALFNSAVAPHYDKYQGPIFFEPYAIEISKRIDPTSVKTALEIACGTGRVTRHLRKTLSPAAKLIATDISPDMLAVAKDILGDENIEWQTVDAQQLPFDDNSIDLIVCAFGYMFLPDKVKGFKEAYRVLRPGGKLLFTTWDKLELNGASYIQRTVVAKYLANDVPPTYMLAFSMNNEEELRGWLQQAGFSEVGFESVEQIASGETAKGVTEGLTMGGSFCNMIMERNPDWMPLIKAEIEKQLSEKFGAEPMKSPMRALFTTAVKK